MWMKRLAATGAATAALGGALFMAQPAMADDDYDDGKNEINQEKVVELNVACNIGVLSIQSGNSCGGSQAYIDDD
jgi:hypothetical protein